MYYTGDASPTPLRGRRVAVLGYGSQGHAHALNLRDSGVDVRVGLRSDSASWVRAEEQGLRVLETAAATSEADVVVVLTPDTSHGSLWTSVLSEHMEVGQALVFGHGFSVHHGLVPLVDGIDMVMIAPKSPGHLVRRMYEQSQGVPGLLAVAQDASGGALELAKDYGAAIGCARAGLLATTFEEETESDLFGEQAVLCGGMSHLVLAGFQVLVEDGVQPEVAYFECLHELKLIVDLMYEGGLSWMRYSVSDTAEWGDYVTGPRIIDERVVERMRQVYREIKNGSFAAGWVKEADGGALELLRLRERNSDHQIEHVGRRLRSMMPWIQAPDA